MFYVYFDGNGEQKYKKPRFAYILWAAGFSFWAGCLHYLEKYHAQSTLFQNG